MTTIKEFLDACEKSKNNNNSEKVIYLSENCFVLFDNYHGIKVRWRNNEKRNENRNENRNN